MAAQSFADASAARSTPIAADEPRCQRRRERFVLEGYPRCKRNTGAADWLVSEGRLMIAYNHPNGDDALSALVVTLWRRA